MELRVKFQGEREAELAQAAASAGQAPEQFIEETMARVLSNRARYLAAVQEGIDQADRGEFIEHEEVVENVERILRS